jgi:hypothetical protein
VRNRILLLALGLLTALALVSTSAFANTSATNTNTVTPTLQMSVTVQKAISLTLSTSTQCTISAGAAPPDYTMNFGTVDALAINAASCGSKFAPTTPGTTNAVYYSNYSLTPTFTNQANTTASITAYVSTNFASLTNVSIVQSNSTPAAIGDLTAMSTNSGAQTSVGSSLASAAAITRYIGVSIAPTNSTSATVTGTDSATVSYTMTVP